MQSEATLAVIGAGYWGKNLVRNFHTLGALKYVCDKNADVLDQMESEFHVTTSQDAEQILNDGTVSCVAIAAPAVEHFDLCRRALLHEKDVFVEKPLALHADQGRELVELARTRGRILMVGHILEYHPAIGRLKELIRNGELGRILYIHSSRLNLGRLRTEENILWSFAPHDISAILHLLGELPTRASAQGGSYLNPPVVDTTLSTIEFMSGVKAHIFVSWLHPFKEQKIAIVGSNKMAVFDDMEKERKLVVYSHRINWLDRKPIVEKDTGMPLPVPNDEPLRLECQHFLDCVRTRQSPRTDGESAVRVLDVLEACERSLRENGVPNQVHTSRSRFSAHPTAVIDEGCEIGDGTKIWHFSHIMNGARIGKSCNLGQNVVVSPQVCIGNNVKVQNNVSIYTGVDLEDDVFCGPSMVFTNVVNPRSHVSRRHEYKKTLVKRGATLGANSTIVCGVTIGRYAFVAAGATVTRDVPDYALVMGVPAAQAGWMCACGLRLPETGGVPKCPACKEEYVIENGLCRSLSHPHAGAGNGSGTSETNNSKNSIPSIA